MQLSSRVALIYQASTYLRSDNSLSPISNPQTHSPQTAKKRAIND